LTTDKRLIIGNEYALKIQGKDTLLTVKGTVMWSFLRESIADSLGNVIPIFKTGLKFIDLSNEKEREIRKFIETHKKEPDEKIDVYSLSGNRLFVRFRLKEADKATVQEQNDYTVKNISLSGLLIESNHALELKDTINMHMTLQNNQTISFVGRVVTCTMIKHEEAESYDVGIEFVEVLDKNPGSLKKYIEILKKI